MVFVPVPDVAKAIIGFTYDDQQISNTLYFYHILGVSEQRLDALTNGLDDWWYAECRTLQSDNLVYINVQAYDLTEEGGIMSTNSDHGGQHGTASTQTNIPGNVTKSITFRTGKIGRSYRGRNYLCGVNGVQFALGYLTTTYRNNWIAAYEQLLGATYVGNWKWGVVSRYHNGEPREVGVFQYVSTVDMASLEMSNQRRRLPGRGS